MAKHKGKTWRIWSNSYATLVPSRANKLIYVHNEVPDKFVMQRVLDLIELLLQQMISTRNDSGIPPGAATGKRFMSRGCRLHLWKLLCAETAYGAKSAGLLEAKGRETHNPPDYWRQRDTNSRTHRTRPLSSRLPWKSQTRHTNTNYYC